MDLLDFDGRNLYFDEPLPAVVEALLHQAAAAYGAGGAELPLLRAHLLAPRNLTVLVALYRFYFYQHRLEDALLVAERACRAAGEPIGFPADWARLSMAHLQVAVARSMGSVRFYLLALKAAGLLCLRLGRAAEGRERLRKVRSMDAPDRLGAGALLQALDAWADESDHDEHPVCA